MPRLSLVARSFSQLSMIMKAPARKKPEPTRRKIQASGMTKMPFRRMMIAAQAAEQAKARIWPTRRTTIGAVRQPSTKPVAQPVPSRPSSAVEKPSAAPRSGSSSECSPFAGEQERRREEQREDGDDLTGQGFRRIGWCGREVPNTGFFRM